MLKLSVHYDETTRSKIVKDLKEAESSLSKKEYSDFSFLYGLMKQENLAKSSIESGKFVYEINIIDS